MVSVGVEEAAEPVEGIREWTPLSFGQRTRWDRVKTACWLLRPGTFPGVDQFHARSVERWLRQRLAQRRYDVAVIEGISVSSYARRAEARRLPRRLRCAQRRERVSECGVVGSSGPRPSVARRVKD